MIRLSCPICGRSMQGQSTAEWPWFPFCSERCRLIDLGRWLGEAYRLPAAEERQPVEESDSEGP